MTKLFQHKCVHVRKNCSQSWINVVWYLCLTVNSKEKVMTGTSIYPCVLFQPPSNFNFLERFEVVILKKRIALRDHPKFFYSELKRKGMTIEISVSEELFDMKTRYNHCVSVLKPYLCLLVFSLMELH